MLVIAYNFSAGMLSICNICKAFSQLKMKRFYELTNDDDYYFNL